MNIGDMVVTVSSIGYNHTQPFGLLGKIIEVSDDGLYLIEFENWNEGHDGNYWRRISEMPRRDLWFCEDRQIMTISEFNNFVETVRLAILNR